MHSAGGDFEASVVIKILFDPLQVDFGIVGQILAGDISSQDGS